MMFAQDTDTGRRRARGLLPWIGLFVATFLAACLFEASDPDAQAPGYAKLELRLKASANALLKTATNADTLFRLDTLVIELSASGAVTTENKYAISGRADTATITVPVKTFALASLRTWKARIYTIDTAFGDASPDTVHRDSVSFDVKPGDTTLVVKTVNPVYSILRARLVSNSPTSITNPVKYVRIRVDGVTRDSMPIGPALRFADFGSATAGIAVGDSGTVLQTSNGGLNWTAVSGGTTASLYGVNLASGSVAFAVGAGGTMLKSGNAGGSWSAFTSGTASALYATAWRSTTLGWAVGAGGTVQKCGGTSCASQTSGTTETLYGVAFQNNNIGVAVGSHGAALRTTNAGSPWTTVSSGTAQDLNGVYFAGSNTYFAVGNGGVILKTTNSGSNWSPLSSGTTADLNDVFCSAPTSCVAVGAAGTILTTGDGTNWSAQASGTAQDLYGVAWTTTFSSGVALGAASAISYSTTGTVWSFRPYGAKSFDVVLAYKYFTPNVSHTLLMDAIDTLGGSLRGYQASKTVLLSPGKDTTVTPNSSLSKCGYSGSANCTP